MARKTYWQRFQGQRISRRRLLVASGTGAAGLAVVAACGGGDGGEPSAEGTPGATQAAGTPRPGGRYKETTAVISDATFGLDPHLAVAAGLEYFARMYNVLINQSAVDPDFILQDLATGMEQVDEMTYVFAIRPGVKIAPNDLGAPERAMDAEDAFVTFDRIQNLELANACQFVCQYFASHQATDPMTYRVETTVPYAWFSFNIGRAISTIPPRELIQQEDGAKMRTAGAGGGPFFIRPGSFVEGERVSLDKNPNYYRANEGRPYMDGWDVTIIPDRPGLRAAFIARDSYEYDAATDAEVDELTGQYDVYKASDDPTYTFIAFTMNVTQEPWTDPRIRKAANFALKRQEYVDIVYEGAAQVNGLVHWPVAGGFTPEELEEFQPYAPDMSKQLIREATGQDSVKIKVIYTTNSSIEEHQDHLPIFIRQMEQAGFEIEHDPRDLGSWLSEYRSKNYQCSLALNQIYETAEIPLDFQHSKGPAGSDIYATGLQDPEVDEAIDATKRITDFDERVAAIKDSQRLIYDKGPAFLPLVTPFSRVMYWDFVKNVPTGLGTTAFFLRDGFWLDL